MSLSMPEIFGEKKDNKNYILWKASLVLSPLLGNTISL